MTIIVPRIPDWILEKLRDVILIPRPPWPQWPPVDGVPIPPRPGPGPDPAPFLEIGKLAAATGARPAVSVEPEALHVEAKLASGTERLFRFTGEEHTTVSRAEASVALQGVVEEPAFVRAASVGVSALRDALIARPDLTRPMLCFLWPAAVTTQLVATTTTDDCGHFRGRF